MRSSNTNFDTYHARMQKYPVYLIEFEGESVTYGTLSYVGTVGEDLYFDEEQLYADLDELTFGTVSIKSYARALSGITQKIILEEGRASISGCSFSLQDKNDEITAMLATDSSYFHRKKTTIKAGYRGMDLDDFLTIMVGWVTGIKLSRDGLEYQFEITDPIKWMQRKIFRGAEDTPVTLGGNPINILLQVLTSTGLGTNGDYDILDAANGLGIDEDFINVTDIETVRDDWFPNPAYQFGFTINERIQAKKWLETEIFKILNIYPVIDADGKFNIKPHKPPLPATTTVQTFDEDNIIGIPSYDCNLKSMINEVECYYDWNATTEEFDTVEFFLDSTSINARGPGESPLKLESKGLTTASGASDIFTKRKKNVFQRYAVPPPQITMNTFFTGWLTEVGDVIPFTHSKLPDIENGTRGLSDIRMEVTNRKVDWAKGKVTIELVESGFAKDPYCQISPAGTITSGVSSTKFEVSDADAAKFSVGDEIAVHYSNMTIFAASVTITDIKDLLVGDYEFTVDNMGGTPAAGYKIQYSTYDNCTSDQKLYWFASDGSDYLGAANDAAHLITA